MRRSRMSFTVAVIVCCTSTLLACVQSDGEEANNVPAAYRPLRNPNPQALLKIEGQLPLGLAVGFTADYVTDVRCGHDVNSVWRPYLLEEPLQIQRLGGDEFTISVVSDKYERGQCDWHLATIDYVIKNGVVPGAAFAGQGTPNAAQPVQIWCKRDRRIPEPARAEQCQTLAVLKMIVGVAPRVLEKVPKEQWGSGELVRLTGHTQQIRIIFHDVDAMEASH